MEQPIIRATILARLGCGHMVIWRSTNVHDLPPVAWCPQCEDGRVVEETIDSRPQRGPDGRM